MTPIIAVFMSMISLLALVADRANLQKQTLSVQGEAIPLPSVDDGVSRNFLDVAKRTLPLKMTPTRTINLRRVPRAAPSRRPLRAAATAAAGPDDVLLQSLIIHALRRRDLRDQLWGGRPATGTTGTPTADQKPRPRPRTRPAPRPNGLGELRDNLMAHGRDRDQLRRRWKIEDANNRVANVHG